MASLHLDGVAAEWYYTIERDYGDITWGRFSELINLRFGPPLRMNGLADLKDLYRTGTVDDYTRQFSLLLCRCDNLSQRQQTNLFTAGLGEPLRTDVELQGPTNLQAAINLARAYERRMALAVSTHSTARPAARGVSTPIKSVVGNQRPRFKRLSSEELAAKRASGECYHCTEKYTVDHKCANKGVFLLELTEDDEGGETLDDVGISLHALTGIDIGTTMKLSVCLYGRQLVALVDTGSTHSFINDSVVSQLQLQVEPRPGLTVKVANGDRVTTAGVCTQLPLVIGEADFSTSFYTLPWDGFDIVLGVHWLRTLGPILWNFEALSMSFLYRGSNIQWTGIGALPPQCAALASGGDLMEALLHSFEDIFREPHGLPPSRRHDHKIRLLPGTPPVAVRPYR